MSVHVSNVLGGWNTDTNQFISALIKNLCLMSIVPRDSIPQLCFDPNTPDDNAIMAIIEGFNQGLSIAIVRSKHGSRLRL